MADWHLITGEYPPQPGGVADYTQLVAHALACRGAEVHVWFPNGKTIKSSITEVDKTPSPGGVCLHPLPGHFGPRALHQLTQQLKQYQPRGRLLVQYVPHAYGWKSLNVPFCRWLVRHKSWKPWIMFHEVAMPLQWKTKPALLAQALLHRQMARWLVQAADHIFVSIPAWQKLLEEICRRSLSVAWLPVPSNVATQVDTSQSAAVRQHFGMSPEQHIMGHFGTYGPHVRPLLEQILPPLLLANPRRHCWLLGRHAQAFAHHLQTLHPSICNQIRAFPELPATELATHLAACDVLLQPYPEGVSCRRGSLMASLALGLPIVSNRGPLSEALWSASRAALLADSAQPADLLAAAEQLLADPASWPQWSARAKALYQASFSLEHTVDVLTGLASPAAMPELAPSCKHR